MYLKDSWKGLDIARAICFIAIVGNHAMSWAVSHREKGLPEAHLADRLFVFFGLFAFFTPLTAGASFRPYFLQIKGSPVRVLGLSLFLLGSGYLMNFFMMGLQGIWHWEALHFLAVSFFLMMAIAHLPGRNFILAIIPPLGLLCAHFGRETDWLEGSYLRALLLGDTERGTYWPLFPWISLVAMGFLFSELYESKGRKTFIWTSVGLGFFLLAITFLNTDILAHFQGIGVWKGSPFAPPTTAAVAILGSSCVFLGLSTALDGIPFARNGIVYSFSRGCFWIYFLHMSIAYHFVKDLSILPMSVRLVLIPLFLWAFSWLIGMLVIKLAGKKIKIRLAHA